MATKCYIRSVTTQPGTGTNNTKANGSTSGWLVRDLTATPGASATTQALTTTAGPTTGQEIATGGVPLEWISLPLAAGVTISGTITFNIWGSESANSENATWRVIVEKYSSTMALGSTVIDSTRTSATELTTTNAAINWTGTPTSTVFAKGDRIRVRVVADDATGVNIGTGSVTLSYDGPTTAAAGDSYVSFNEALTFASSPAGSTLFPTTTVSVVDTASDSDLEAWTSRGSGTTSVGTTVGVGWITPVQIAGSGALIDWFTRPLQAFTLSGIVRFGLWIVSTTGSTGARAEVAVVANDGTLVSVWGAANLPSGGIPSTGSSTLDSIDVSGADVSVTNGQRLRLRLYTDDRNSMAAASGTLTLAYAGTSGGASGDTFATFTQTLTELTSKAPPFQARTARNTLLRR